MSFGPMPETGDVAEIFGVSIPTLPDGAVALEAIVLVKGVSPEGASMWWEVRSAGLSRQEALGMAITFADTLRASLVGGVDCQCDD